VVLTPRVPPVSDNAPPHKVWGWGVSDIAALLGLSEARVIAKMTRREIDPYNLESICVAWLERIRSPQYTRKWDSPVLDSKALDFLEHKAVRVRSKGEDHVFSLPENPWDAYEEECETEDEGEDDDLDFA
jgi:hypothetical protein